MCLCHRAASHVPSEQCCLEDFGDLGAASVGANEYI